MSSSDDANRPGTLTGIEAMRVNESDTLTDPIEKVVKEIAAEGGTTPASCLKLL